ncbi:MAG: phosphopyruvate hydratase, partial [Angelakisella sp.]
MQSVNSKIASVQGLEIIDSRGNPTVKATVTLECGAKGSASVPSGASTGVHEAHELRDGDRERYGGKGVRQAVGNVNTALAEAVTGLDATDQQGVDSAMMDADGSRNKLNMGANAILAVSLATARAAANARGEELYRYLAKGKPTKLPVPMMNILNGGAHATNNVDIQEFMIMPKGAPDFTEGMRWCSEIYHTLGAILKKRGLSTGVGDEGGFAPSLNDDRQALDLILEAVQASGFTPGKDIFFAIDAAASEWLMEGGAYMLPKSGKIYTPVELISFWEDLTDSYPLFSLEDGVAEDDWQSWKLITQRLGNRLQLVGDDLFVTNVKRLSRGIEEHAANAILIKPNQIGTLSQTLETVEMAQQAHMGVVLSHRSGETEDSFIADIAV